MTARMLDPAVRRDGVGCDLGYQAEIAEWRKQREARLKADGGWLTVAGLFWLHDGANRFGKDQERHRAARRPGAGRALSNCTAAK